MAARFTLPSASVNTLAVGQATRALDAVRATAEPKYKGPWAPFIYEGGGKYPGDKVMDDIFLRLQGRTRNYYSHPPTAYEIREAEANRRGWWDDVFWEWDGG